MTTATAPGPALQGDAPLLFALAGSEAFAQQVAQEMGLALCAHEEREFEDGEHKARPCVNVRGRDVYVVHSLHAGPGQSPNDKLCRLLFFIGALKDAAAARVTAVVPYLAYARKDRKTRPRDPVTTRYVATLFEAVGTDALLTIDVHNLAAFQNAFRRGAEHLDTTGLFTAYFAPILQEREVVVVAPDAGAMKRAEQVRTRLARMLGKPVGAAMSEKYRSGGTVSGELLVGEVGGKDALIVDDLVSGGTTLARSAAACAAHGAARIFAAATHGLLLEDAPALLAASALREVVVTDTVPTARLDGSALAGKLRVLSCTGLFAQAIRRLHEGGSIVELLEE